MYLFHRKYIRQFEANIFTMTKSVVVSQRIAGILSIELDRAHNKRSKILSALIHIWNIIVLCLLFIGLIQSVIVIMGKSEEKLRFIIYFAQFGSTLYLSLWLRYQRKQVHKMMCNIQNCINNFPNATLREHHYIKICLFIWIYIILQSNIHFLIQSNTTFT